MTKLSGKRRKPYGARVTTGWEGNRQVRKYIGYYETKMEAISALAEYNKNPYDVDAKSITFSEVWEQWKEANYDKGSKSTQSAWRVGYDHCRPIHDMRLLDIKLTHLEGLIKGKGRSTQSQIKTVCSKVFTYGIVHEWTDKNPAQYLELSQKEDKSDKTPFSEDEIKDLWEKSKTDEFYELVLILIYTGLRVNELLTIRQEDVYEDYMVGGSKTEAGKNRIIPLHRRIRKFVKKRLDGTEFLVNQDGEPLSYRQFQHPFTQKIQHHTLHECRHTFISRMHSAGVNEITLKMIVGHAMPDITSKVYIHKSVEELVKAVHKIK